MCAFIHLYTYKVKNPRSLLDSFIHLKHYRNRVRSLRMNLKFNIEYKNHSFICHLVFGNIQ